MLVNVAQAVEQAVSGAAEVISRDSNIGTELVAKLPDSLISNVLPIVFVCIIFYILMIRPHQAKLKQHKQMLNNLAVGDKVITSGGLIGVIYSTADAQDEMVIEIAKNVRVSVNKNSVTTLLPNTSSNTPKVSG